MAEDDDLSNALDDAELSGDSGEGKKKRKFLSEKVQKMLAYVVLVVIAVIVSVTISFFTFRLMNRGNRSNSFAAVSDQYAAKPEPYTYFSMIPQIRTRTADKPAQSLIVKVDIGYDVADKQLATELVARSPFLTDLIRNFFSTKTASELTPDREAMVKNELKNRINDFLKDGQVKDIIFTEFQIIEM
jgi:flagellar basal body-associated protein FliL